MIKAVTSVTSTRTNRKGILYGVLATAMFAAYILTNRYVYIHYDVDVLAYVVTFTLWAGFFALLGLGFNRYRGKLTLINKGTMPVILTGMLAAVGVGLIVLGQKYTTAINASIIATASIIPTILFSRFILKERFTRSQWLWLTGLFAGLYLAIVGFRGLALNMGDAIILGSAVVLGFTNTYSKVLMKSNSSDYVADVRLIGGALLFLILGLLLKGDDILVLNAALWPVLGGLFYWLTIKFFYASIQYINPSKAITLINSHPIVTPIVGVLVLSEHYKLTTFAGSVILLASIYFINRR
jgi:drug/metabolite transporter (DMT)-like permease